MKRAVSARNETSRWSFGGGSAGSAFGTAIVMIDAGEIMLKRLILMVAFIAVAGAAGVIAQNRQVLAEAERVTQDRFTVAVRTRKGANVYAVRQPNAQMLAAIDKGLDDLFAVARKNGYSRRLRHRDYSVFIGKADRTRDSAGKYSPDIAVGAAQYAGTDYDQGGFIYAAGMVIAFNPMAFVIAEHERDYARVSDLVRFEGEHLVLFHNDRRRYQQTADHSQGGGHPIMQ